MIQNDKFEQSFLKYMLQLIYNKTILIMTVLNRKSGTNKGKSGWIIVIVLCLLVVCEIQCIKFGRKQSNINNTPQDHIIENKTPSNDQANQVKKQQTAQKEVEKPQKDSTKSVPDSQTQKTQQSKAQVSLTPTIARIPQHKPIQSIQSHHALDSLFGSQQPAKEQLKQQKPQMKKALTITPEKQSNTGTSVSSTVSTTPNVLPIHEEVKNKDSMLGGLFGEQNVEKAQVSQEKKQVKPTPTQVQKPTSSTTQNNNPVSQAIPLSIPNAPKEQQQKLKQNNEKRETSKQENEVKKEAQQEKQQKSEIKPEQKPQEKKQQPQKQSDSDEEDEKTQKDKKQDSDQQSDDVIYSKDFHKSPQASQFVHEHKQSQSKYSFTLLLTFCLYSIIIVMVIVTIKCTNTTSKAAKAVNVMVDALGDMFKKKQGYRPALNEEEVTDREEEITVGYKVEDNQKIFWEKNSVEGI